MGPSERKVVLWEGLLKEPLGHRCSLTRSGPSCRLLPVSGFHCELWALFPPTCSSVAKHSTFRKQAALRKMLANSGGRFSPLCTLSTSIKVVAKLIVDLYSKQFLK